MECKNGLERNKYRVVIRSKNEYWVKLFFTISSKKHTANDCTKKKLQNLISSFQHNPDIKKHIETAAKNKESGKFKQDVVQERLNKLEKTIKNQYHKGKNKIEEQYSSVTDREYYQKMYPGKLIIKFQADDKEKFTQVYQITNIKNLDAFNSPEVKSIFNKKG